MPREEGYKNLRGYRKKQEDELLPYRIINSKKGEKIKVDKEDYEWLNSYKWHLSRNQQGIPYVVTTIDGKQVRMHRLILGVQDISFKDVEVDHQNGDTLDNTRKNIRLCTHQENMLNRGSFKKSSSKYKHVRYNKNTGKWDVRMSVKGEQVGGGSFKSEEVAGIVANVLMEYYHKEYARLNEIADIIETPKEVLPKEVEVNSKYLEYINKRDL